MRDQFLGLFVLLGGLFACGGSKKQPVAVAPEPPGRVSWSVTMKGHRDLTPALAHAADKAGCELKTQRESAFNALCPGAVYVFAYMSNRVLVRGCGDGVTQEACAEVWSKIMKSVEVADEESTESTPAPASSAPPAAPDPGGTKF